MTDRNELSISLDHYFLNEVRSALKSHILTLELASAPVSEYHLAKLKEVESLMGDHRLMDAARTLKETETFIAFEHPEKGDEAPVMIYSKVQNVLIVNSGLWDCDDTDEINTMLDGHINLH